MDYSSIYFGKSLKQLQYEDISNYFQLPQTENDQIEFKSYDASGNFDQKLKGIRDSICAFLNSSGGIVIWGAPKGYREQGKQEKIFKGELTPLDQEPEKDWLINKVSDRIIPLPGDIKVQILTQGDQTICVFEIQESIASPHQTDDRYYMRIDGQKRPAPHHYIEALFKKTRFPELEGYIKFRKIDNQDEHSIRLHISIVFFNWSPLQNEEHFSFRLLSGDGVFQRASIKEYAHRYRMHGHEFFLNPAKDILFYGEPMLEMEEIVFNKNQLVESNGHTKLLLHFGGKHSPMRTSEYELNLGYSNSTNINDIVAKTKLNRLMLDVHRDMNTNKQAILNSILKDNTI